MDITSLKEFLNDHVRPMYFSFDRAHDEYHYDEVVQATMQILSFYKLSDLELISLVTASAYHDTGRLIEYEEHEKYSIKILKNDMYFKSFLKEVYPEVDYEKVIKIATKCIKYHRSRYKTKDELCLILKDADKVSHLDKTRGLYRPCAYCVDKVMPDEKDKFKLIMNRILYFGGKIKFTPKSKAMKAILGEEEKVILISDNDIVEMMNMVIHEM